MRKYSDVDWHDLSPEERKAVDEYCDHPSLSKERPKYAFGQDSGDFVCDRCGIMKSGSQWKREGKG